MNQTNTVMLAIFMALGVMLVAGLISTLPMQIQQADAAKPATQSRPGTIHIPSVCVPPSNPPEDRPVHPPGLD
jgi:hypothetical protein